MRITIIRPSIQFFTLVFASCFLLPGPGISQQLATEDAAADVDESLPVEPAVAAIRNSDPKTPAELVFAIQTLMNLDNNTEAVVYLQKLAAMDLDDAAMYRLNRRFGSTFFLRLAQEPSLRPHGLDFSNKVFEAAQRYAKDPVRLEMLVKKLSDPEASSRQAAFVDLQEAGSEVVAPIISVLADSERSNEHQYLINALVEFGAQLQNPLASALQTGSESVRLAVIEVFGRQQDFSSVQYLIHPFLSEESSPAVRQAVAIAMKRILGRLPTKNQAEEFLYLQTKNYLSGKINRSGSAASVHIAARLGKDLHELFPGNEAYRLIYLASLLEAAKTAGGVERSIEASSLSAFKIASSLGVEALEQVLQYALKENRQAAAIAATEVLGEIADANILHAVNGNESGLALALRHGNRRLQFAAVLAILKIEPSHGFSGASYLPRALAYFVQGSGSRKVVVASPRYQDAQLTSGLLMELGFQAESVTTSKQIFQKATSSPDYEFLLIGDGIDPRGTSELIQMLRRDFRTRLLPVGVISHESRLAKLRNRLENDRLTQVFTLPLDGASLTFRIGQLLSTLDQQTLSADERRDYAQSAVAGLKTLAEKSDVYHYLDLLSTQPALEFALESVELSSSAAGVLGLIGTPAAQRRLVNFASENSRPYALRKAAAEGFRVAVNRRGLLLTTQEMYRQYDRYNQSEQLDVKTQQLLGSILDTMESRVRGKRDNSSNAVKPTVEQASLPTANQE